VVSQKKKITEFRGDWKREKWGKKDGKEVQKRVQGEENLKKGSRGIPNAGGK